jgi:hypothetical protein
MTEQKEEQELPTAAKARRCTECNGIITILQGTRSGKLACYSREGEGRECSQSTNIGDKPLNERIADDIELVRRKDHEEDKEQALEEQREEFEQLIQNKIENKIANDLDIPSNPKELLREIQQELLEEVQNQ